MSKRKKNKKLNLFSKLTFIIYLLISIVTLGIVVTLKILPIKYMLVGLSIYGLTTLISGILLMNKKIKKQIKIVANIICILFIIIFCLVFNYLNKTLNFMDKILAKEYQLEEYYVLVLESSGYENLNQVTNLQIGIYDGDDNYKKALDELDKKISFKEKKYKNYVEAATALLEKKEEVILMNASYKTILDEQLIEFGENVRILDTITVKIKNESTVENVDVTKESFNIYISGIDIYGDISLVSRSDVNMIATINPTTHEILLTSIPRDFYVQLHGTTGYKDKLTHAGLYGINMSVTTLEDLFEINIDYYVRVNFTTLINLVDAIGGINVYSDLSFTALTDSSCKYVKGNNQLTGKCALAFSRERYAYQEGDRHRVQNQQNVLTAILNKTLSSKTLITKYTSILESLGSSFQTNMPKDKIYSLVNMQLDEMPSWNVESISVNGSDSYNYTYSYSASKLYVMEPNMKTVATATSKIKGVLES